MSAPTAASFEKQGYAAHHAGAPRVAPTNLYVNHGLPATKAWYRGWDAAHRVAPQARRDVS